MLLAPTVCLAGAGGTYTWITQNPLPEGQGPFSVSAADSTHVWAVGAVGGILFYNGTTITRQASDPPCTYNLNGVHAVDSTHVWAVGDQGTILFYNGDSWAPQGTGTTAYDLESVWGAYNTATSKYNVWAVCDANGFTDAKILFYDGTSWKVQSSPVVTGGLADITGYDTSHVWAVDEQTYYYTTPAGHPEQEGTWSLVNNGVKKPYVISACSVSDLWSITWEGEVLKSTNADNGTILTWESAGLYDYWPANITVLDNNNVWVSGWDGKISYYNGGSWAPQTSTTSENLYDIFALDGTNVYTVGNEKFLASTNGGSTWASKTGGTTLDLNGVSAFDATHAWAVGAGGTIVYTSDGGLSWVAQVLPVAAQTTDLYGVYANTATDVWAVGWNATAAGGQILHYNGTAWSLFASMAGAPIYGIGAFGTTAFWCVSPNASTGGQVTYYTGSKWVYYSAATSPLKAISMASTSVGYAVGDLGGIYNLTKVVQNTWTQQGVGLTTENLLGVSALSTTNVWACGANGKILYTSNGGVTGTGTWAAQTSGTSVTLRGVSAADASHIWAVGDDSTILFSDGTTGGNWTAQTSPKTVQFQGVDAYDLNNAWAVGAGGTILFADPPYIKRCYPTWGNPGETEKTVEVVGAYTHFDSSSVVNFGEGITYDQDDLKILDYTVLRVRIDIAPDAARGPRDVSVVTGDEVATPLSGGFTVGPLPAITGTEKPYGVPGWTGDVVVTGRETHFDLTSQAGFGDGIEINYIKDIQPDKATANISIASDAALGARDVNIVTAGVETPAPLAEGFTVSNPVPAITSMDPASGMVGGAGFTLTVNGSNFVEGAAVNWNGKAMATTRVSSKKLTATINAADIPTAGIYPVTVTNPSPCSAASNPVDFTVSQAPQVSPVVNSVSPGSGPPGTQVTVKGSDFGPERGASYVTFGKANVTDYVYWSDTQVKCKVPAGAAKGPDASVPVALVTGQGSSNPVGFTVDTYESYFAEGTTREGYNEWLCLQNPGSRAADVHATYMRFGGSPVEKTYSIPPTSRMSVNVNNEIGPGQDVSVMLWSEGEFYAERPMYFDYKQGQEGYSWTGGHCATGAPSPRTDWYFAEGTTREGFEEWVCIQNPNNAEVEVEVDYISAGAYTQQKKYDVDPQSRISVFVNGDVGPNQDVSMHISCDSPIVAERPMYFNYKQKWTGGHVIMGTDSPKTKWYFAEGSTQPGFEEWLAVQNATDQNATVTCTFLKSDGTQQVENYGVGANSRWTLDVSKAVGVGVDSAIVIESSVPVVAERPMYFSYKEGGPAYSWTGGHDVVGAPAPKTGWFFAEGCTYDWADEYICVANPGTESALVTFSFMLESGDPVEHSIDIAPHTRATVKVADIVGRGHDVSTKMSSDKPVVAERPMYFNYNGWTGGHDVVGF